MDENNIRTSVVIELADQEEPNDQKTYRIDIDDVDSPKDYVIDQIFCGENVTVYALFEVPEGSKVSEKNLIDLPNSNFQENYKFFHKNSYKEIINQKKVNGYKYNSYAIHSDEDMKFFSDRHEGNGSLYCLKHLGGDYEMLTPEKKNSELKILYSKETVSKSAKLKTSKGLKFKSKGVNTDIVQSPRIIEEVQRTVGLNVPFAKNKEKNTEGSCSSFSKSSYEVIEMEMRQSYSSVNSDSVSGRCSKNSVPNFFIVPLLMMEDGILSHHEKTDKRQKLEEEKHLCPKKMITSFGTNTDLTFDLTKKSDQDSNDVSQSESYKTDSENYEDQNLYGKKENSNDGFKINSKETIINEIKIMQRTLNVLIKSIESNDFIYNAREKESDGKRSKDGTENLERMSELLLNETCQKKYQKLDERPIFLPFEYPSYPNKLRAQTKKKTQSTNESKSNGTAPKKSVFNDFLSKSVSSETIQISGDQTAEDNIAKSFSNSQINCLGLENRKTFMQSKSESCVPMIIPSPKHNSSNGLKKSCSFDLKCDKMEALKKTKNFTYKTESNIKTKTNIRIHQNKESLLRDNLSLMESEMGDDVDKKPININNEVLNVTQITAKTEKSENSGLEEIVADIKKNFNEEKGDAKLVYPKETLVTPNSEKVQVNYHYTNVITSESSLKAKKSISPRTVVSKMVEKSAETGTKISSDAEKPITPNKSSRKMNVTDSNPKKDVKINKKTKNKIKVEEKVNKSEGKDFLQLEIEKKKTLTGSRKSARYNGDSKLHIDKLIKLDNLRSTQKAPSSAKNNQDEKVGAKSERVPNPIPQKQDFSEHSVDVLFDENIKEKSETAKENPTSLVQVESCYKNNEKEKEEPVCLESKGIMPEEVDLNLMWENFVPLSSNPLSVVVELFSKKPKSMSELYYEVDEEKLEKTPSLENMTLEKNGTENEKNENSENLEKPIVKSVWALTKVLLYEDGTNKLEVLEASLTPPDYSLN